MYPVREKIVGASRLEAARVAPVNVPGTEKNPSRLEAARVASQMYPVLKKSLVLRYRKNRRSFHAKLSNGWQ